MYENVDPCSLATYVRLAPFSRRRLLANFVGDESQRAGTNIKKVKTMRIALIDTNPKPKVYPVALLKLGAWRRKKGDECVLFANTLPKPGEFDTIWLTTTFTYDLKHSLGMAIAAKKRAERVRVGGIAATLLPEVFRKHKIDVHEGLVPEAEECAPDYRLLPEPPEYAITHTSRGCVRKCDFCMVKKLEPRFESRGKWENDLPKDTTRVLFYDNNWLAKPIRALKADTDKLRALKKAGRVDWIDFNQGLDARLMKGQRAELLRDLPFAFLRFAFDGMHEDGHFQEAIKNTRAIGYRNVRTYVLYNFRDTPSDFYYRLRECARLSEEFDMSVTAFPMRYQPIAEADLGRNYVGKHWTERMKKNFMMYTTTISSGAMFSFGGSPSIGMSRIDEFEFWLGKDEHEFLRLLNYPKLSALLKRKKVDLRMRRAHANEAKRKGKTK